MKKFLRYVLIMFIVIAIYVAGAHTLVTLFSWLYPLGDKSGIVAVSYTIMLIAIAIAGMAAND